MSSQQQQSGWGEWSKHVLKELERLNEEVSKSNDKINREVSKLNDKLQQVEIEVAKLQVKASIWGGVTGFITTLIALVIQYLKATG